MAGSESLQRAWLSDVLEGTPSLVFFALWRSGVGLEIAGWIGAFLAACVLVGFSWAKMRFNPIMLGINLHLLMVTPLIVAVLALGFSDAGTFMTAHSYKAVMITICVVGCALTIWGRGGFVGCPALPRMQARFYSLVLVAASIAATAWAFTASGGALVSVALPIMGLFALRRFLLARGLDEGGRVGGLAAAAGGASLAYDGSDDL